MRAELNMLYRETQGRLLEKSSFYSRGVDDLSQKFRSPQQIMDFLQKEITEKGTAGLAGLEEEIIVLTKEGIPLSHAELQAFLSEIVENLPQGKIHPGKSVFGDVLHFNKGTFQFGSVNQETNTALIEYAHKPCSSAWTTFCQSNLFLKVLEQAADDHSLMLLGAGAIPNIPWEAFKKYAIPNSDYVYSWEHIQAGTRPEYCRAVFGTMGLHHNMGFADPKLLARYTSTVLRLLPTMIALVGNSPIWNNQLSHDHLGENLLSYRSCIQLDYGSIYGMPGAAYLYPDFLIDPDITFETLVNGFLSLPLDHTSVDGEIRQCGMLTMAQYLKEGIIYKGKRSFPDPATLNVMFRWPTTDIRLSLVGNGPRVEARAHDGVSQPVSIALDAFYRGILANLDEAQKIMRGLDKNEIRNQRVQVCRKGLASPIDYTDKTIKTQRDLALRLLGCAEDGLIERGQNEEVFLNPLFALAETGINPAQRMLTVWRGGDRKAFFDAIGYNKKTFADGMAFQWPRHDHFAGRVAQVHNASFG